MSAKEKILEILEQHKGETISGEDLATQLCITRAAVWKSINSLKKEGYQIQAATNAGYSLARANDILSEAAILPYLQQPNTTRLCLYKTIDSTNKEAKRLALEGAPQGTCVISEEQTAGRGRLGRSFYSPNQKGIYLSMVLKPKIRPEEAILITTAAAVAVCRSIQQLTGIQPAIKWVNDVYVDTKKICGILTEAVTDFETGHIESIVLGIGINFSGSLEDFPPDLQEIAGVLFLDQPSTVSRGQLVAQIINQVLLLLQNLAGRSFIEEYKQRSWVLGQKIKFSQGDNWEEGLAVDIDQNGGLVVDTAAGRRVLNSGEVSVRRIL